MSLPLHVLFVVAAVPVSSALKELHVSSTAQVVRQHSVSRDAFSQVHSNGASSTRIIRAEKQSFGEAAVGEAASIGFSTTDETDESLAAPDDAMIETSGSYRWRRRRRRRRRRKVLGLGGGRRRAMISTGLHKSGISTTPKPINCEWQKWDEWTECTETCGGGDYMRKRTFKTRAKHGGNECQGPQEQTHSCNVEECPTTTTRATTTTIAPQTTTTPAEKAAAAAPSNDGKKKKMMMIAGAASVGVLGIVGAGAFFVMQKGGGAKPRRTLDDFTDDQDIGGGDIQFEEGDDAGQY